MLTGRFVWKKARYYRVINVVGEIKEKNIFWSLWLSVLHNDCSRDSLLLDSHASLACQTSEKETFEELASQLITANQLEVVDFRFADLQHVPYLPHRTWQRHCFNQTRKNQAALELQ